MGAIYKDGRECGRGGISGVKEVDVGKAEVSRCMTETATRMIEDWFKKHRSELGRTSGSVKPLR